MLISVVGAGYVGLVTAACLSELGHTVRCVERDRRRVDQLVRGEIPIREPELEDIVAAGLRSGRLSFHHDQAATHGTELVFVAVGTLTASGRWTGRTVVRTLQALVRDSAAPDGIAIRSTLMPGTAARILSGLRTERPSLELAYNPEFTREGSAVADFMDPDRVILGVPAPDHETQLQRSLCALYQPLNAPLMITDLTSAELIKVGSNVFLATKVTLANELARLAASLGANINSVVDGIAADARIGRSFLSPGPGFGGACLPSQSRQLPLVSRSVGVHAPLMRAIHSSNVEAARWQVELLAKSLGGDLRSRTVAILGATFKAGTDDVRESPALRMAAQLVGVGAIVRIYDPLGTAAALGALLRSGVQVTGSADAMEAVNGADGVIVATEWPEFALLDWEEVAAGMMGRVIVDARGVVDADAARRAGLEVIAFGRPDG